jgi:hypothetical protein
VIADFQKRTGQKYRLATTAGYGPRYLHSTGQLHKAGPNSGHFILLTARHKDEMSILGRPYKFGVLADAQAVGDTRELSSSGRHLLRLHLRQHDAATLSEALNDVG